MYQAVKMTLTGVWFFVNGDDAEDILNLFVPDGEADENTISLSFTANVEDETLECIVQASKPFEDDYITWLQTAINTVLVKHLICETLEEWSIVKCLA